MKLKGVHALKQILKTEKKANPFSLFYDAESILKELSFHDIQVDDQIERLLSFTEICHKLYVDVHQSVFSVFDQLNLEPKQLKEFLFFFTNASFINLSIEIESELKTQMVFDAEKAEDLKLSTQDGRKVNAKLATELNVDALQELLILADQWIPKVSNLKRFRVDVDNLRELEPMYSHLLMLMNIFLNIRTSGFEVVMHESGDVELRGSDKLKIKSGMLGQQVRRAANEIRKGSHINTLELPLLALNKANGSSKRKVLKATSLHVKLQFTIEEIDDFYLVDSKYLPTLMILFEDFADEKLDYFDGLTLRDLGICFGLIDSALTKLIHSGAEFVSYKLNEDELVERLADITNYPLSAIQKLMKSLKSNSEVPYFWRAPLYQVGDDTLIPLLAFMSPNYSLYYEKWLGLAGITLPNRENITCRRIVKEFNDRKPQFPAKAEQVNDIQGVENMFTIQTKSFLVFIHVHAFEFPIEQSEFASAYSTISTVAKKLRDMINGSLQPLMSRKLEKDSPIFALILTNHSTFCGEIIEKVFVTDWQLLTNYFHVGKFQRVRMTVGNLDQWRPQDVGTIHYYRNEDEFNENFQNFLASPPPISQVIQRFITREQVVTPQIVKPTFIIDQYMLMPDQELMERQIESLTGLVQARYFENENDADSIHYSDAMDYYLKQLFSKLAFSDYESNSVRSKVLAGLKQGKLDGLVPLTFFIYKSLARISEMKIVPDQRFEKVDYDSNEVFALIERIPFNSSDFRFAEFDIAEIYDDLEARQIASFCIDMIPIATRSIVGSEPDDGQVLILAVNLMKGLKSKLDIEDEFYTACTNVIDLFNNAGRYQRARNFSEEILIVYNQERQFHQGWGIQFRCYIHQKIPFDAGMFGCLLMSSVTALPEMPYGVLVETLYNVLRYFRNFGYLELSDEVYKHLKTADLNDFDEQKVTIVYFGSYIQNGEYKQEIIDGIFEYVESKKENIKAFGNHGIIPWLSLLYNLNRIKQANLISFEQDIDQIILDFERELVNEDLEAVKDRIIGNASTIKEIYIKQLIGLLETLSSSDYAYEVSTMQHYANTLLRNSILMNDVEGVLLAGHVINDQSFSYTEGKPEQLAKLSFSEANTEHVAARLRNYKKYICDQLTLKTDQYFMWVFNEAENVYCMFIDSQNQFSISHLASWDVHKMQLWLADISGFIFNKGGDPYYDLAAQQECFESVKQELSFTSISFPNSAREIIYTASLNISAFPHNLILDGSNFIGWDKPICYVPSLEWLISNSEGIYLPENYSVNFWAPIEDQEGTINWGYSKVRDALDKLKHETYTSRYPDKEIVGDINIFLAHGRVGRGGFHSVYTNDDIPVVYPESIFGKGIVAVLFICHSGSTKEETYSHNIVSFAGELLKSGYKAVVAPAWKLDVTTTGIWLKAFLKAFNAGSSISISVHAANLALADYDPETSSLFLAPQASLDLHLFGNPNIFVKK